jgi:hypothetical protein
MDQEIPALALGLPAYDGRYAVPWRGELLI